MNNTIKVDFDTKTKRLVITAPFHLNDAVRSLPSRRFDPKSKTWRVPMVRGNLAQISETRKLYDYQFTAAASEAIFNAEEITAAPKHVPFPTTYDFNKAPVPYVPMGHQTKMLDLAWGLKSAAWFAKMGTGKTFAAIHLACARWLLGQIDGVMIVCPSTLRRTWMKELKKFATVPYDFRLHETKASWLQGFYSAKRSESLPILAVSVEGLGVSEALYDSACGFMPGRRVMVICDESSRIKNPDALRTGRAISIGAAASYRIILNGTPIAIGIQDLWSQYEFLDPNIIGSGDYWAFKTRYIETGGFNNKQIVGYKNVDELMKAIIPYTCEVGKDVLDLPPKVMKQLYCVATKEQKMLFKLIIKGASKDPAAPMIKVDNVLERMLRLRQVVGGYLPRAVPFTKVVNGEEIVTWVTTIEPLKENPKMDLLFDMIENNYAGSKFIIWTTFIHEIEFITEQLVKKYGATSVASYYGKTEMSVRSAIEDRYCNDPSLRFFVGNPVAAGLGLTLISGENDVMVYYSGTNAFIDRAQSADRAHRIGQKNTVVEADLIMEGTVDQIIADSIAAKMDIEEYLMTRIAAGEKIWDKMLGDEDVPF